MDHLSLNAQATNNVYTTDNTADAVQPVNKACWPSVSESVRVLRAEDEAARGVIPSDDRAAVFSTVRVIVGGKNANLNKVARQLGVGVTTLGDLMRGERNPTAKMLREMDEKWPKIFATEYEDAWKKNKDLYKQQIFALINCGAKPEYEQNKSDGKNEVTKVSPLSSDGGYRAGDVFDVQSSAQIWRQALFVLTNPAAVSASIKEDWRAPLGVFIKSTMHRHGHLNDAKDGPHASFIDVVKNPDLQYSNVWRQIWAGDTTIKPDLFKLAVTEIRRLCDLETNESQRATELLRQSAIQKKEASQPSLKARRSAETALTC